MNPQAQSQRGWWSRHWKWAVPAGCLTLVLLCVGFVALIAMIVFGAIKSSDAYKEALVKAKADERVQALLGEPIKAGLVVTGSIHVNGPSGNANLAIPVSGPDGAATIYLVATKRAGRWEFSTLEVAAKRDGARIDLMAPEVKPLERELPPPR